jgi:hypothetical protein
LLCVGLDGQSRSLSFLHGGGAACAPDAKTADRICGQFQSAAPMPRASLSKSVQIDYLPGRCLSDPRSGFERDLVTCRMVTRTVNVSPGRTGRFQCSSSTPGEPKLDALGRSYRILEITILRRSYEASHISSCNERLGFGSTKLIKFTPEHCFLMLSPVL